MRRFFIWYVVAGAVAGGALAHQGNTLGIIGIGLMLGSAFIAYDLYRTRNG